MDPLLLLHGALGSKTQFDFLVPRLEKHFELHPLNFEGHGNAEPADRPFRIEHFVENVLIYLDEHDLSKVNIFGYSMGGYVALALAKRYPEYVCRVATLGTVLRWDQDIAERECRYLHPEKIKEKVPHFAEKLSRRHTAGWGMVVDRTREMLQHLGRNPLLSDGDWATLELPIRLHVGDRDTTAGLKPTIQVYDKMGQAELNVLPATAHSLEEVQTQLLLASLTYFYI